jgi:flagellar motor protein MotB
MTYGDMVSLLLVFFIFVTSVGGVRFERSGGKGLKKRIALAEEDSGEGFGSTGGAKLETEDSRGAPLLARVFFEPESEVLTPRAMEELRQIAPLLWSAPAPLLISGYVSPWVPESGSLTLPGADRRAFARAMAVLEFLRNEPSGTEARDKGDLPFLPASGGWSGSPIGASGPDVVDGRDRVDIYPLKLTR